MDNEEVNNEKQEEQEKTSAYNNHNSFRKYSSISSNPISNQRTNRMQGAMPLNEEEIDEENSEIEEENQKQELKNEAQQIAKTVAKKEAVSAVKAAWKNLPPAVKLKIIAIAAAVGGVLFLIIFLIAVLGPNIGGTMDITNETGGGNAEATTSSATDPGTQTYPDMGDLSGYSQIRQEMVKSAYSALGGKYVYGGSATAPTLDGIKNGIDCSAFVSWILWIHFGNSTRWTTQGMYFARGSSFIEINQNELKPGDIGLNYSNSSKHTGLYVGDGQWIHASSPTTGIIKGTQNFEYFLRYHEIPEGE